MKLTQDFRAQLYGPWEIAQGYLVEQFDHLIAQISASYGKQHTALDAHGDVTADSLILTGTTILGQALALNTTAAIIPNALTANTNDYNPTGLATASIIHLEATGGPVNLTGVQCPVDQTQYRILIFIPAGTSNITFVDASPLSALNNRFALNGINYVFGAYPFALMFDASTRYRQWRPLFRGDP